MSSRLAGGTSPEQTVSPAINTLLPPEQSQVLARFRVYGTPRPQGSKRAIPVANSGKPIVVESNAKSHAVWRNAVSAEAHKVAEELDGPLDGPLGLEVTFRFPMPASRKAAIRRVGLAHKVSAPDTSKLIRSVEDSMQAAGLIVDDARFATVFATKVEIVDGWTGCEITIRRLA